MRTKALWLIVPAFSFLAAVSPAFAGDPSGPEVAAVVSGNNQFAFDLYARLAGQEQGNLFFSPYSVSTALAMTYAGARGNTEAQMAAALHFSLPQDDLHAAFGDVIGDLNGSQREGYQLKTANRLWGQQGYGFLPEYLDVTQLNYGAELAQVDFIGATEPTRQTINHWVEEQTQQKIKNLIPSGALSPQTRLVLTNAIYFKSDWKYKFDPDRTQLAPFWTTPDEQVNVSMMHQLNNFKHAALPTFQILELPYTSEDLSMIALLPNERDGLAELEASLTAETLSQSADQMVSKKVALSIPKFGMTQKFGLSSVLSSLGMSDAFSPTAADFSGMNGEGNLHISGVLHKAFINLDEEGTEAAAATGVVVGTTSAVAHPIPQFYADHPFVFFIRDNRTESILFMGRVADLNVGAVGIVPEPATLSLLALGSLAVIRRRRAR